MRNPYTLYLVTDTDLCPRSRLCQTVESAILGGVTMVQLREKNLDSRSFYQEAVALKQITAQYQIPLLINDRLDIALAANADGLHIGQSDLPVDVARRLLGSDKILGVSASSMQEATAAVAEGADYLGVGALFSTDTKTDAEAVGLETVGQIVSAVPIPVIGIGGIHATNLPELCGIGLDGIAVVSAIMAASDPRLAAEELKQIETKHR